MNKLATSFLAPFLFLSAAHCYADDSCDLLNIQITNQTNETCVLKAFNINHGNLANGTAVPSSIIKGDSKTFVMDQTLYGPDITVEYACGPDIYVTFRTQQNYCFTHAGDISGHTIRHTNANITFTKVEGSYFWGKHGTISWDISRK